MHHDADAETECNLSLSKERRSGLGRRKNETDSESRFRSQIEREYRQEIMRLSKENEEKSIDIERLHSRVNAVEVAFHGYRDTHKNTLHSAHSIVSAGLVLRTVILSIIAVTAMIGGISATVEIFKGLLQK